MDQSDIEQLTAIFAKLGYDISITKRKADEKKEETKEQIIPKKAKTEEKKEVEKHNAKSKKTSTTHRPNINPRFKR